MHEVQDNRVIHSAISKHLVGTIPGLIGKCGNLAALIGQDSADRLERITGLAALIDERDAHCSPGSRSPAKNSPPGAQCRYLPAADGPPL